LSAAAAQAQGRGAYLNNVMANAGMMAPGWGGGVGAAVNPGFGAGAFVNPYTPLGGGFNNPYTPGGIGGGPFGGGGGLGNYGVPFTYGGIPESFGPGYFLMGTSEIMKAYGTVVTADQQARIMAEQAEQAHIDTLKKRFEYRMFVEANTIPYSEVQAKHAKQMLHRVLKTPNPNEIVSGKSVNILLQDLEGARGKKIELEPISLSEDTLKHLNVTTGHGNLGLLRNDGRFTWPPGLVEIVPAREREEVESQAQTLVNKTLNGVLPVNVMRDLQSTLEKIDERLLKKINDPNLPGDVYRSAKRFLENFKSALVALNEPENAIKYFNYQKWATGSKTIKELVDYMLKEGLRFAPAVQGDESAYRALQGALAAYDNAYNHQITRQANASKDGE
jgi:hypothetical protein